MVSNYWKHVGTVLSGSLVAQIIPIVGSLIIARLFLPETFGIFSAWISFISIVAVVATCRFEASFVLEPDGEPRYKAVIGAVVTAMIVLLFIAISVVIIRLIQATFIDHWSFELIIIGIVCCTSLVMFQIYQSWLAANKDYKLLSTIRIISAGSITSAQIFIGLSWGTPEGLALGHSIGLLIALCVCGIKMPISFSNDFSLKKTTRELWKRHYKFPTFSLPADTLNVLVLQAPVLIIAYRFGAEIAGYTALSQRLLGVPIGLLGKSVLDVFKRHAATTYIETGQCVKEYLNTFWVLSVGALCFGVAMLSMGEQAIVFAFGESWQGAAEIAVWLTPMFCLRFVASPLSYMIYIAEKQYIDLVAQLCLFLMMAFTLSVSQNYGETLTLFCLGYSLWYLIYLAVNYRLSHGA